jgi:hypothetical protein
VPVRNKAATGTTVKEDEYESESGDEEADQLDMMKARQYGKRGTRNRKQPAAFGYKIDPSQIELSDDEI